MIFTSFFGLSVFNNFFSCSEEVSLVSKKKSVSLG